ncbi:MAG: hypothetical protein WB821_14025 [Burkholderiaceae bacterium]
MGFINWLLAKPPAPPAQPAQGLARPGLVRTSRPGSAAQGAPGPAPVQKASAKPALSASQQERRVERNARRDDLFQVVRESMVRAGVMSSTFKFKVLPLDQLGRTFLVMIDLAAEYGGETGKLNEVEALITRGAKNRHAIAVQGVYWRFYEPDNVHEARVAATTGPAPLFDLGANLRTHSQPSMPASHLAAARAATQAVPAEKVAGKAAKAAAPMTASMAAIHNKLLLTGYESTEFVDPDEPGQALSPTQYGDMR